MPQTRQNLMTVPVNADAYNLTTDLASMADSANVPVRVSTTAARDALTKYTGLVVQRLDLPGIPEETWDGSAWQGISWVSYSPSFAGWSNLGSDAVQTGSYLLVGKLCTVRAKLAAGGTGASLGTGNLAVSLPFTSASDQYTIGDGLWYPVGSGGFPQRVLLANPASNIQAAIVSNVAGPTTSQTPGNAGLNYGSTSEVHCNITYRVA